MPSNEYEKEQVAKRISELNIEFLRLQFVDIFGVLKSVNITIDELDTALDGKLMFDGSSIDGFARINESDQCLVPDPDTLEVMPWRPREKGVARMICDVYTPDGEPFEGCPRNNLKRVLKEAEEMGYQLNVGPEGEFFLFFTDDKGRPTKDIHDKAGYFDLAPVDLGDDARRDIVLTMKSMGFKIEASHHEVAPGQHEIDFKYDEALRTADNWITFRDIVKNIAKKHDLYATFMPKPFSGENGSAMHCNQSLFKGDNNIFFDPKGNCQLSMTARQYIGGLLKHAKGMTAIGNPTVNSYKRLKPGYEAPVHIAWSNSNRSSLIRVPSSRGLATRVEYRSPDPTANPYLIFAVMVKAGLEGIKENITPPDPIDEDLCSLNPEQQNDFELQELPQDLNAALKEMEKDPLVKEALGEHIFKRFIEGKREEWKQYAEQVHDWETKTYLGKY